jgi:magnesium chelatase subunit H
MPHKGDPVRLLYATPASPHHSIADCTYVEEFVDAGGGLHASTHGSLEFMLGKPVVVGGTCYPDHLIHSTATGTLYYNPASKGTITRRRSYASTISYLTPPTSCLDARRFR